MEAKELADKERTLAQGKSSSGRVTETEAMIMARPSGKSLFSQDVSALLDAEKIIEEELAAAEAAANETKDAAVVAAPKAPSSTTTA